jgi:steroid delta-isomerase-like uncharacterized protein
MSTEQNKSIAQRFTDQVFNKGDLSAIDELFSANYVNRSAPPGLPPGPAGTKIFVTMFRSAFPDLYINIEDTVAEGDRVVVRWVARGTHLGVFQQIPPAGKQIAFSGIDIVRIADGKIVEGWGAFDQFGMLQQLGVMPAPGQSK